MIRESFNCCEHYAGVCVDLPRKEVVIYGFSSLVNQGGNVSIFNGETITADKVIKFEVSRPCSVGCYAVVSTIEVTSYYASICRVDLVLKSVKFIPTEFVRRHVHTDDADVVELKSYSIVCHFDWMLEGAGLTDSN